MKLKEIESLDNASLLDEYANSYGRLVFDFNNENLQKNFQNIRSVLMNRLNKSPISNKKLFELVADEKVILEKEDIDLVTNQLLSHLKTVSGMIGKTGDEAKIIVCIDHSGSMGSYEKYCARGFMTWIEKILCEKYKNIFKDYIVFHTEASLSDENKVFNSAESGGTIVSSGLHKVNELINNYNYEEVDTYVFLISDGDNLSSDIDRMNRLLKDIERKVVHTTYLEINQYNRSSTIKHGLNRAQLSDKFNAMTIRGKEELLDALEQFCENI